MAKKPFDARAARALTEKATADVTEYLELIETAAGEGKSNMKIWLHLIGKIEQNPEAVERALKALGFKATHYPKEDGEDEYYHVAW